MPKLSKLKSQIDSALPAVALLKEVTADPDGNNNIKVVITHVGKNYPAPTITVTSGKKKGTPGTPSTSGDTVTIPVTVPGPGVYDVNVKCSNGEFGGSVTVP